MDLKSMDIAEGKCRLRHAYHKRLTIADSTHTYSGHTQEVRDLRVVCAHVGLFNMSCAHCERHRLCLLCSVYTRFALEMPRTCAQPCGALGTVGVINAVAPDIFGVA